MMMGGWWYGIIFFILIIILVINYVDGGTITKKEDNPLSILDKRYANGEIDDEEYLRRKELLKK